MRGIRNTVILGAVTVALVGIGTGTALADPPSGTVPALTDIVGVGSDTVTPLFAGSPSENAAGSLVTDYNSTSPANKLWSWDAVNPSTGAIGDTIVTKGSSASDTTCSTARPDGSGAGIAELEKNAKDGGDFCVDFARSSRAPASTDPNTIAFAAMARDGITYSSPEASGVTSPVPENLTWQDLAEIYSCNSSATNWSDFGGGNAPIVPVLPQNGSGTRATFLLALGGGTTPLTPGSCVVDGTSAGIEENTGLSSPNEAQFDPSGTPAVDDVFPYSIGDYIAQDPASNGVGGHASSIWGHGVLSLHAMNDDSGTSQSPTTTNASGQTVLNTAFPSEMLRILYNVVRNGNPGGTPSFPTTPAYEATALPALFGPSGWICTNATAKADITSYGFTNLGRGCGALTAG